MTNPFEDSASARPVFGQRIDGTWGEFTTPGGRVAYLMTSARLGQNGVDDETRLTSRLRPVREMLDLQSMSFSQLLQRDLDDYRVASDLIPYVLNTDTANPAFFPPILAVLLPFTQSGQTGAFPPQDPSAELYEGGLPLLETAAGAAYSVRKLRSSTTSAELSSIKYGQLAWNEELARVVVLDGQHRAMALLAIQRTIARSWDDAGRGARYRHFYEKKVSELVQDVHLKLEEIRVPVTVCWFPDMPTSSHEAARRLFVDVNKEARPPSPDRVVLLDDEDLVNIFTRELLDSLRAQSSRPPLHAIEYDRSRTSGILSRWSSISSLQAVKWMVQHVIVGPRKYVDDVGLQMRGAAGNSNEYLRNMLRVLDIIPSESDVPGQASRDEIGQFYFSRAQLEPLVTEFLTGWGGAIKDLLGRVEPFAAHYAALDLIEANWQALDGSAADALAKEAVFGGGGLYWTLRANGRDQTSESITDLSEAWARVLSVGLEFEAERAKRLLPAAGLDAVESANDAFSVFSTQACQGGLALTFATVASKADRVGPSLVPLAGLIVSALNASLRSDAQNHTPRLMAFARNVTSPVNTMIDINTPRAIEYRYFWLEMLCAKEGLDVISMAPTPGVSAELLRELRDEARGRYVRYLVFEAVKVRLRGNRSLLRAEVEPYVTVQVLSRLSAGLDAWFDISAEDFTEWSSRQLEMSQQATQEDEDSEEPYS